MNILITGATGFAGSYLIEYALAEGCTVYGMKRAFTTSTKNIDHIKSDKLIWVDCDLKDHNNVDELLRSIVFERIFHLAAQTYVPASYHAPGNTMEVNIIGTVNLLESVRKYNKYATVMICSSSEVYGHQINIPTKESEPFAPLSPYAVSKCTQDILGTLYHRIYELGTVISRAFTHTGERQNEVFFIPAFARQIARIEKGLQEPVIKVGNLESQRTIMDVRDCVNAYWMLTDKGEYGEAYNIGGVETWSVETVLRKLISMSSLENISIQVQDDLLRPKDVNMQVPDCSKFKKICDWKPTYGVEDTLEGILNFWRKEVRDVS